MHNRLRRCWHALATAVIATATATTAGANPTLLFEPATGQVLYAEEPDRLWYPASVTKLMTAYLTFDAVKTGRLAWDDDVPLSDHARSQPATRIGLRAGIKLNVEQAVRGLVLRSANDFAVALAERVGGTEDAFVHAMNDTAKRLGMSRTVFRNPHGLPDPEQVTTARDLATLTAALLRDFPDRAEVFSTPSVHIHRGTFYSQNDLLKTLEGADGMKTGFTCASGYNIVASATRDGHKLVAIVLGEYSRQRRSTRATELIEAGFAYLSADPALQTAVTVPAAAPMKTRYAKAALFAEPQAFVPVTLRTLPVSPAAADPAGNIGREVRTRTCRGYSGFSKPEPEHEHDADDEAAAIVTGAVVPARPESPAAGAPQTAHTARPNPGTHVDTHAATPEPVVALPSPRPKSHAPASAPKKAAAPAPREARAPARPTGRLDRSTRSPGDASAGRPPTPAELPLAAGN